MAKARRASNTTPSKSAAKASASAKRKSPRSTSSAKATGRGKAQASSPKRKSSTSRKTASRSSKKAVEPSHVRLFVLSDSTGNLAHHMLTAFLTQFPKDAFDLRLKNFLNVPARLDATMDVVEREPGIVFHALVSPEAKQHVEQRCKSIGAPCCDLTGHFVQFLAKNSGIEPDANIRRLHDTTREYHRRMKALEFTLEHDDGLGLDTINQADIVLAGVSRTSKTPTSIYLAQLGYRVANVSLAQQVAPPQQLLGLSRNKVVGLVIDPNQLSEIRKNRGRIWAMSQSSYSDSWAVQREVAWSRQLFTSKGWRVLDVTDRAVEETAAKIVDLLGLSPVFQPKDV